MGECEELSKVVMKLQEEKATVEAANYGLMDDISALKKHIGTITKVNGDVNFPISPPLCSPPYS